MTRRIPVAAVVAVLVILAGCTGGPAGGPAADGTTPAPGDGTTPEGGVTTGDTGTVHFYVSDEPNAIGDFEHLNVTISAVGLHRVDGGSGGNDTATPTATPSPTPENGTATPENGTATPENDTASPTPENGTSTADGEAADDESDGETDGGQEGDGDEEDGKDGEEGGEDGGEGNDESDAGWVEYQVNRTVDLTELVGANATKLDVLQAPAGTYDKVFVYVEEIDAVLENGESVNVKLPSEKLHINKQFVVGNGQTVEFVFDIAVHKAGKSGKYILKPVVSQSGTGDDVEIEDTDDENEGDEGKGKDGDDGDERGDDAENETADGEDVGSLQAEFVGPIEPGKEATVKVTGENGPVANASVAVDGEVVGTTGADGTLTFEVPSDAEKIEVTVRKGDAEVELQRKVDERGNGQGGKALGRPPG